MNKIYNSSLKFFQLFIPSKLLKKMEVKRVASDVECHVKSKKIKLSKEEKKNLHKENRKIKQFITKCNSSVKDYYTENCEYYFEHGLRKVHPYYFTFKTNVKRRWIDKPLIDVFLTEFYADKPSYVHQRIEKGYLLINNQKTSSEYKLREPDIITHRIHRHEFPVLDHKINILHENENVTVVCKPSSIPIHSVSKYHFNTVQGILTRSEGLEPLRVVHRIDRMTSGILIFAKNYETANLLSGQIQARQVSKFYLAVVKGQFDVSTPIECNEPLGVLCQKFGLVAVMKNVDGGKDSSTKFLGLQYDEKSNTTLVICKPLSGRTHQIRVHLQFLGYPISNDPLYNCTAWGPDVGKSGVYHKSKDQLIMDLQSNHNIALHQALEMGRFESELSDDDKKSFIHNPYYDSDCEECISKKCYKIDPSNLVLYLHSYRYRFLNNNWDYVTDLPEWTNLFYRSQDERSRLLEKLDKITGSNDF